MQSPESKPPSRCALIVAADSYEDPKLRALRAPARDAQELARVLGDPDVGAFNVSVSLNEPDHLVRRKLSEFFRDRSRDDLLLLHVSCHGLKDEDGTLYFASANTAVEHLEATAVPSEFVNRQMTKSRSRRIVLLLDCCFGGAFARGMVHRAGEAVAIKEEFEGQGRVVLTASRAMEYAFEGDNREGDAQPSIFTSAIVHGLESGEADRDHDSRISVDELYDYVYDRVRDVTPNQTPSKWTFDVHGDLYLARSPFSEPKPVELPVELRAAIESPFANVRVGAVEELARLSAGSDAGLADAARAALEELGGDDSRRVSETAVRALRGETAAVVPMPVRARAEVTAPEEVAAKPAPPAPTQGRFATALAEIARARDLVALAGVLLLLVGYFRSASWETGWYFATKADEEIWGLWSPATALLVVLLVAVVARLARTGRIRRATADAAFAALGLLVFAAMIAFVGSYFEFGGLAQVTIIGALLLVAAGLAGLLTTRARAPGVASTRAAVVGGVGALLVLGSLQVKMASWEGSDLLGDWSGPVFLPALVGGAIALGAAVSLRWLARARFHAAGALIAVGAFIPVHMASFDVQIGSNDGADDLGFGAAWGIAGGLLLVGAGIAAARSPAPSVAPTASTGVPAT